MTPNVKVSPTIDINQLSHHISLSAPGEAAVGLIYADTNYPLQRQPMSSPDREFAESQSSWTGGTGRQKLRDDPFGYLDSKDMWGMTENKVFPTPMWKYATGFRTTNSTLQTGSTTWKPLYGATNRYIAIQPGAITAGDKAILHVRRVGTPGTLTFQLANDHATPGKPGTSIASTTVTKTVSDITDYVSVFQIFDWTSTQNLLSTDWLYVFGASTDNESNHWEVAVNTSGTGSKVSADGSTWTTPSPNFALYYRVVAADTNRRLFFFEHENQLYIISANAANTAPTVWINGERGKLTASSAIGATTVTDSSEGCSTAWSTDQWVGARIRFIGGTGAFQRSYSITANDTSGVLTITPALEIAVDNTTRYVIYSTPVFTALTFPAAPNAPTVSPTCRPISVNGGCYIAQGTGTGIIRFHENDASTNNHEWSVAATTKYDFLEVHQFPQSGLKVFAAEAVNSKAYSATAPSTWNGSATFVAVKPTGEMGTNDSRITNMKSDGGRLFVAKEDSIFEITETTPTNIIVGAIKDFKSSNNGKAIASPDGNIITFGYGNSLGQLTGTQFSDLLNYRAGYNGLATNRKGYVSAMINVGGWMFFSVDGGTSNYSTVYAWNRMGLMELWRSWDVGVRVRDIYWQACPDTRGRLWIDAGGEPIFIDFPLDHSNPRNDTSLNYQPEFVLEQGVIDIEKEDYFKFIHEIAVMSENLSSGAWIEVDYRMNEGITGSWIPLSKKLYASPSDNIICDLGKVHKIQFRFRGYSTSSTTPPVITTIDIKGRIAEPEKFMWFATFKVGGRPPKTLNGQTDFDPTWLVSTLVRYAREKVKLNMGSTRDLDNDKVVNIALPADTVRYIGKREWAGTIDLKIVEA